MDDDCDGEFDEASPEARLLYPDADSDGWGVPGVLVAGCAAREGYSLDWTDCDDTDAAVHPEAADDVCDSVDQNCDGQFDEGAPSAQPWYPDGDGDGYGTAIGAEAGCVAPSGMVAAGGDCDDTDPARNPGTAGEQDCVGWSDAPAVTWGSVGTGELGDTNQAALLGARLAGRRRAGPPRHDGGWGGLRDPGSGGKRVPRRRADLLHRLRRVRHADARGEHPGLGGHRARRGVRGC